MKAVIVEQKAHPSNPKQKFILKCRIDDINCYNSELREIEFSVDNLPQLRNTTLNEDRLDDLTNLSYLNDPAVLNTIHCRYQDNIIYTYSGLVLVSLNPYCDLGLYGDSLIQAYSGKSRGELEPHLFAVSEDAFRTMQRDQKNQSIIISGESGAGKTISARYVMRYFASAANSHLSNDQSKTSILIESRVLASNPILEAFGNAKTTRNDNSSRFGKYVQIFFNQNDEIVGAAIKTYLLEKTRVTKQSPGERNYHIFYQLIEGSEKELKDKLYLSGLKWDDFEYLKMAGCSIENVSDAKEFALTQKSMKTAGFSGDVQLKLFRILSAILHLGNLKFQESEGAATIQNSNEYLKKFSELLGFEDKTEELARLFTRKLLVTKLESVEILLTPKQAEEAKDAVAKFLYSKVFDFIVKKLNELLSPTEENGGDARAKNRFIGVLDIYGFEKFDKNSFEQFCINYANEKLQQEFNQQVFKLEQELYEREEIMWSFINFSDNQPCIDLIEIKGGILDLLDEECRFPNGGDQSFLEKIKAEIPKKGTTISGYLGNGPLENPGTFTINHFAYNVAYSVDGFLEKNRDLIPMEIIQILKDEEIIEMPSQQISKSTTGSSFRDSLSDLMKIIQSTQVHYIRCIKPNNSKVPMRFEPNFVMQQLRAGGIIETIKISAAGYPARWSFDDFYSRYSLLSVNHLDCKELLESQSDLKGDEYQIGKTQIFLRSGILARLEKNRTIAISKAATLVQSSLRFICINSQIKNQMDQIRVIQSSFKYFLSRELCKELERNASASIIQTSFRMYSDRINLKNKVSSIKIIQIQWKSHFKKTIYFEELRHRMVSRIQNVYRARRENLISNLEFYSAKQIQSAFRGIKSNEILFELRKESKSFVKLQETSIGLERKVFELTSELETLKLKEDKEKAIILDLKKNREEVLTDALKEKDSRIKELEDELLRQKELVKKIEEHVSSSEGSNDKKELKELKEEKMKLELKFAKIEKYVRTLMINHTKACVNSEASNVALRADIDCDEIDKMASQNSLMNFISDEDDTKLIKFTSTTQILEELLKSESILKELRGIIATEDMAEDEDQQEILMRPSRIIYSWLTLSLTVPKLYELTEFRMNTILEGIRGNLSESTDDKKCSLWLTNLIHLYGMIHHFIQEKEDQLKVNHYKIVEEVGVVEYDVNDDDDRQDTTSFDNPHSITSSPTTQISVSELPPPVLLLIRAEVMRLIGDIYSAWLRELCRWFGRAGIDAILEHEELSNYKVRKAVKKTEKFFESVLKSLVPNSNNSSSSSSYPSSSDHQNNTWNQGRQEEPITINGLLEALDDLLAAFLKSTLDLEIIQSILLVIFRHMSIISFNQLLVKRNFISWKRAIQIQFNLSRLEDWCRERIAAFGIDQDAVDSFAPLLQAVKVIQLAKTRGVDSGVLQQCAPNLAPSQIRKLLMSYVPDDFEDGPVPTDLIRQFPVMNQNGNFLLQQLDLNKLILPVALKKRLPPIASGMASELPLDMPPTLWKLFVLYLK